MNSPLRPTRTDAEAAARYRAEGSWRDVDLGERLRRTAREAPGKDAIIDGSVTLTFDDLDVRSAALAQSLRDRGVGAGDVVSYQLPSWWEAVVIALAAMRLGAVANPLLPNLRHHELRFILDQARPSLVITAGAFRGFDHVGMFHDLDVDPVVVRPLGPTAHPFDELLAAPPLPHAPTEADGVAMLLYTSGTTASPKGVLHTHNTLDAEGVSVALAHEITRSDTILVSMPMAHIGGVLYAVLLPLVTGCRSVLLDVWDGAAAARLTERHQITVHPGVPVFLQSMLEGCDDPSQLESIRLFALGGARVAPSDVRRAQTLLGCWSKRSYGSTEMPTLTTGPRDDGDERLATSDGTPTGSSSIRISGPSGEELPVGVEGEIWCRGPELFVGYLDASLNDEAFSAEGWFKSGDLGRVDADGWLTVTGRSKDVIIRGGENISPSEIEDLLLEDPRIADIAIVAMPDARLGERACAFVVADGPFELQDAVGLLRDRGVATFKLPERLERRDDLPRTAAGKIRKDLLRDEAAALVAGDLDQRSTTDKEST